MMLPSSATIDDVLDMRSDNGYLTRIEGDMSYNYWTSPALCHQADNFRNVFFAYTPGDDSPMGEPTSTEAKAQMTRMGNREWATIEHKPIKKEVAREHSIRCICAHIIWELFYIRNKRGDVLRIGSCCIKKTGSKKLKEEMEDILFDEEEHTKLSLKRCEGCSKHMSKKYLDEDEIYCNQCILSRPVVEQQDQNKRHKLVDSIIGKKKRKEEKLLKREKEYREKQEAENERRQFYKQIEEFKNEALWRIESKKRYKQLMYQVEQLEESMRIAELNNKLDILESQLRDYKLNND